MGHEPAMTAAEIAVRAAWEPGAVENRGTPRHPDIWINGSRPHGWFEARFDEWDEGWKPAHAFTLERREEKRKLKNDIRWTEDQMRKLSHQDDDLDDVEPVRIIARLQAALTEANRGMKGAA